MERTRFSGLYTFGMQGTNSMCYLRVLLLMSPIQGMHLTEFESRSNMSITWLQDAKKTGGKTEMHLLMNEFITELKHNYSSTKEATPLCD